MTIREAIEKYTTEKANYLHREYKDVVNDTSLSIIIPLKNGISIFIDVCPYLESVRKNYPLEMPNKNGIFKRLSFEILDYGVIPVIPKSMEKYVCESHCCGVSCYIDSAKEKVINEFISANGGINTDKYFDNVHSLWPSNH